MKSTRGHEWAVVCSLFITSHILEWRCGTKEASLLPFQPLEERTTKHCFAMSEREFLHVSELDGPLPFLLKTLSYPDWLWPCILWALLAPSTGFPFLQRPCKLCSSRVSSGQHLSEAIIEGRCAPNCVEVGPQWSSTVSAWLVLLTSSFIYESIMNKVPWLSGWRVLKRTHKESCSKAALHRRHAVMVWQFGAVFVWGKCVTGTLDHLQLWRKGILAVRSQGLPTTRFQRGCFPSKVSKSLLQEWLP